MTETLKNFLHLLPARKFSTSRPAAPVALAVLIALIVTLVLTVTASATPAGTIMLVSDPATGIQLDGWGNSPMTADGRYVVFTTGTVPALSIEDPTDSDVIIKDLETGDSASVVTDSNANSGNGWGGDAAISVDGHFVVFLSSASNLVPDDTYGKIDVFVKDTFTGATTRVSTASGGLEAHGHSSSPQISGDGRYVVFTSAADNLVPGDTNNVNDVFVKDLQLGTTSRVSVSATGQEGDRLSDSAAVSFDGHFIAFKSEATNLVTGDTNNTDDIFLRDMRTGTLRRVNTASDGSEANNAGFGWLHRPSMSADGRYIAFDSFSTNLVPDDSNNTDDIFLKDTLTGHLSRISTAADGTEANGFWCPDSAPMSADGTYVVFKSCASNLVPGDNNGWSDIFIKDVSSGAITRASVSATGVEADGESGSAAISADGRFVTFLSVATNLVPEDTGGVSQIYRTRNSLHLERSSDWSWYDDLSAGARNWVLLANPQDAAADAYFDLAISGSPKTLAPLPGLDPGQIPAGVTAAYEFPGTMGGPVEATSRNGDAAITSLRSLWGDSLEEIPGNLKDRLSDNYLWPWYDMLSPGTSDWIVVANPSSTETVTAAVNFKDQGAGPPVTAHADIPPSGTWAPTFPGKMGGPVELQAYRQGGSYAETPDRRPVIASQRVLTGNGAAFNEVPGTPAGELSDRYLWTWYDQKSPGMKNWVLIDNPSTAEIITAEISFTDQDSGTPVHAINNIMPGGAWTPTFAGKMGGPVEVKAYVIGGSYSNETDRRPVIASQRVLTGLSFEEKPGTAASTSGFSALSSNYHWTWYDEQGPGALDWVLIANPSASASVFYEMTMGDNSAPVARSYLDAGQIVALRFPGVMMGPVSVRAWTDSNMTVPAEIIASQRVLWKGFFNEVEGQVLG